MKVEKAFRQEAENLSDIHRLTTPTTTISARKRFLVPWIDEC
ncbi:hypothetical protein [Lepagella muris]|nr:hypothetical protein [Lepagella muris]